MGYLTEQENLERSAGRGDAQHADKSGVAPVEGRSPRSSPSAGKPRTRRRGTGDAYELPTTLGKAMYVAPALDREWLQNRQRELYTRSWNEPDYVFCKLWGLVTDLRNLRTALARVARNRGRRTAGVDGITVAQLMGKGADVFVEELRAEMRAGAYRPSPVRRVLIPKPGQPGKHRPLGIPTVKDRVVQASLKNILEPIFEADFFPTSHGFRQGKSAHGALEHLRRLLRPKETGPGREHGRRLPYQWAIEGDIRGCFDNISHHGLMERVRRRVGDAKVNRLVLAFLKAGVLAEGSFFRTDIGTPQGGILSPLLANVALSALDERYTRHAWDRRGSPAGVDEDEVQRRTQSHRDVDRRAGRPVLFPVRYADDFLILIAVAPGPGQQDEARQAAIREKTALAVHLKDTLNLELSEAKTLVTPVTEPMRFLGHHVRVRAHPTHGRMVSTTVIPKECSQRLRERIKDHFRRNTTGTSLEQRLRKINPALVGWCNFYRHSWGAKRVFSTLDHYIWWTIFRWLQKKHSRMRKSAMIKQYGRRARGRRAIRWGDGPVTTVVLSRTQVQPFNPSRLKPPPFVMPSLESPVHNERCTPGSVRGARKRPP
jgi:RNA-directed DNA polymerase